jgi:DNA (cytosine-5)-methyltransferase 1
MDTSSPVTHIGLCAGYGGIELGLHRAVRGMRTIALCEIEAFAIANLVSKMEAGLMDPAPIWPDLKTFPWAAFRDRVDILTGGYPCQPFSAAGQRRGKDDPRHLWPYIADGIRLLRPKLCFFENVEGHISLGLSDVIEDLAGMGYRTTWGIFSASECGAPHQRKRVFILAYDSSKGSQGREWLREAGAQRTSSGHPIKCSGSMAISSSLGGAAGLSRQIQRHEGQSGESDDGSHQAWPSRPGEQQYGWEPPRVVTGRQALDDTQERCLRDDSDNQRQAVGEGDTANDSGPCCGEAMGDSESSRAHGATGSMESEEHQEEGGESEIGDTGQAIGNHGCGTPNYIRQTQPSLGRDTDGSAGRMDYAELCVSGDNRTDELRLLGNGVVPATAERAFRVLMKELYTAPAVS